MGMPNLSVTDQAKVDVGNLLMEVSASLFESCLAHRVPCALENPHSSRLWQATRIRDLLSSAAVRSGYLDFCQYQCPWRKRTRLMYVNVDLATAFKSCSSKAGKCDRTGLPHTPFLVDRAMEFMTHIAEAYPKPLVRTLAQCFANGLVSTRVANLCYQMSKGTNSQLAS